MDAPKLPSPYDEMLEFLQTIPPRAGTPRKAYMDGLPKEFWEAVIGVGDGAVIQAARAVNISQEVIARYCDQWEIPRMTVDGIAWADRERLLCAQKRIFELADYTRNDVELSPHIGRMVFADLHWPMYSEKYLNRGITVARKLGYRSVVFMGDTANLDAASKFADLRRGDKRPPLQQALGEFEEMLLMLKEHFDEMHFVVGNHELRLLRLLQGHFSAEYLFGKLLNGEKFIDADHIFIGDRRPMEGGIRLVHRWRGYGRKAMMSEPAELCDKYKQDVGVAHSHRYGHIWTNHTWRAWMLGGMLEEKEMLWRMQETSYIGWQNGFFAYHPRAWKDPDGRDRFGLMQGFTDGETDWESWGCE